jgi:hypothetical protein
VAHPIATHPVERETRAAASQLLCHPAIQLAMFQQTQQFRQAKARHLAVLKAHLKLLQGLLALNQPRILRQHTLMQLQLLETQPNHL